MGKFFNPSRYSLEDPTYFKDRLTPLPTIGYPYDDIIKNNDEIRKDDINVNDLRAWLRDFAQREALIQIHKAIVYRGMKYLNIQHENEILAILNEDKSMADNTEKILSEYLPNLAKKHKDQQSYLSSEGWREYFYPQEWKKESQSSTSNNCSSTQANGQSGNLTNAK